MDLSMGVVGRFVSSFAGRAEQTGLVYAAAAGMATFQRGLLPRNTRDQAIVTGATTAAAYGVAIASQSVIDGMAHRIVGDRGSDAIGRGRMVALAGDIAAVGVGGATQVLFAETDSEKWPRAALRTLGRGLLATGVAGSLVTIAEEVIDRRDGVADGVRFPVALPLGAALGGLGYYIVRRREMAARAQEAEAASERAEVSAQRALVMSVGVASALGVVAVTERLAANVVAAGLEWSIGANPALARPVGHVAALGGLFAAGVVAYDRALVQQERGSDAIEAAYNVPPEVENVSGGPRSLVAWEPLSREGRRFVGMALSASEITEVMDEPAVDPLRLYVGLESAGDPGSRVDLMLDEMLHMGAYERGTICVFAPTGSGYVNYVATETVEYLTRGDVASICLQYSKRPSFMSLDKVALGRMQIRDFLRAISMRIQMMPEGQRPRLLLFGESLGSHVSQDAFLHRGVQGLHAMGIEAAVWLGTPHASEWRHSIVDHPPLPDDLAEIASPAELQALGEERLKELRYCLLTHHEDPIPKFTPKLIVQKPKWLGDPAEREPGLPKETVWTPYGTFLSVGIDLLNAMNIKPGQFHAFAHDYRSDIRPVVQQVFRLESDEQQAERIDQALRDREALWARKRVIADEMSKANDVIMKKLGEFSDAVGV
jgi:uncharacterized membrane protein